MSVLEVEILASVPGYVLISCDQGAHTSAGIDHQLIKQFSLIGIKYLASHVFGLVHFDCGQGGIFTVDRSGVNQEIAL